MKLLTSKNQDRIEAIIYDLCEIAVKYNADNSNLMENIFNLAYLSGLDMLVINEIVRRKFKEDHKAKLSMIKDKNIHNIMLQCNPCVMCPQNPFHCPDEDTCKTIKKWYLLCNEIRCMEKQLQNEIKNRGK